jgi:hypothetical protein
MKLIIAGGRDYKFTPSDIKRLDEIRGVFSEVVCGCARGADTEGRLWAESRGIPVAMFPANWSLGKSAGYQRNKAMALYADGVILFKGGKGTDHMFRIATKDKINIWDWREDDEDPFLLLT